MQSELDFFVCADAKLNKECNWCAVRKLNNISSLFIIYFRKYTWLCFIAYSLSSLSSFCSQKYSSVGIVHCREVLVLFGLFIFSYYSKHCSMPVQNKQIKEWINKQYSSCLSQRVSIDWLRHLLFFLVKVIITLYENLMQVSFSYPSDI